MDTSTKRIRKGAKKGTGAALVVHSVAVEPHVSSLNGSVLKTPQELIHLHHTITLNQYKTYLLLLRNYREIWERGECADADGYLYIPVSFIEELMGYDVKWSDVKTDMEALRREPIRYNVLMKNGKTVEYESGFISEFSFDRVAGKIGYILPTAVATAMQQLDLKDTIFYQLHWSVFNSLSGKHDAILYNLCKDYEGVGVTPVMTLEEYRQYMGISIDQYPEFKTLNHHVIKKPMKAINENEISPIDIDVLYGKDQNSARKTTVSTIQFTVKPRENVIGIKTIGDSRKLVEDAFAGCPVRLLEKFKLKMLEIYTPDQIRTSIYRAQDYVREKEMAGAATNQAAIYRSAIQDNWGADLERNTKALEEQQEESRLEKEKEAAAESAKHALDLKKSSFQSHKFKQHFDQISDADYEALARAYFDEKFPLMPKASFDENFNKSARLFVALYALENSMLKTKLRVEFNKTFTLDEAEFKDWTQKNLRY